MRILETNRLLLRLLEPDDLDDLFALYKDPDVVRYIPDAPQMLAEAKEELDWFLHDLAPAPRLDRQRV